MCLKASSLSSATVVLLNECALWSLCIQQSLAMSGGCQSADVDADDIDSSAPRSLQPRAAANRGHAPLCLRCNAARCATVHRQQPLCRSCHIATFTSRFRQTLKRQCGVQPASRVLVGWSGGLSSSVLCELMRDGIADRSKYRLMLHWDIVHVDCSSIRRARSEEQRSEDEAERSQRLSRFHTTVHILPLSAVFDTLSSTQPADSADRGSFFSSDCQHRARRDDQLRALFRSVQPANHARLLSALLAHLLSLFCRHSGYSTVLTAESATHAATAVISAITKGRGRVAAVHTRMQRLLLGARWAYPLHDTSHTHIAYMFHYQRLATLSSLGAIHVHRASHPPTTPPPSSFSASYSSSSLPSVATLDSLSRSFIASLDSLFGHSVANVLRTVEKVDRPDVVSSLRCCCWCGETLPPAQQYEEALSTQSHSDSSPITGWEQTDKSTAAARPSASNSGHPSLLIDSCYDCRRSFTLPLRSADSQHLIPDCIRLFDSTAHQQQQQLQAQAEVLADTERTAAAVVSGESPSDTPHQRARHAARHGDQSSIDRPQRQNHTTSKQTSEQMRAHIQQFLLDESKEGAHHSRVGRDEVSDNES